VMALAGSALFVVGGAWIAGLLGSSPRPGVAWVGWVSMAFFGLCGVLIFRRMFDRDVQLRISPRGIMFKPWSDQTVPWTEITDIGTWELSGQRSIILKLADPSRFPSSTTLGMLAGANRALTGGDIPIQLNGTDGKVDDALAAINRYRRAPYAPHNHA
jgi:hypothetical protein